MIKNNEYCTTTKHGSIRIIYPVSAVIVSAVATSLTVINAKKMFADHVEQILIAAGRINDLQVKKYP
jgi:Na+-transporting NADH:ubiquinone oxidoreductase subunit NqrC